MNKSSKFTKVLSMVITVVMLLGVMAVGMVAYATHYTSHTPGQIYLQGDTVDYNGAKYQAKWWTQTTPGTGDAWTMVSVDPGNIADENAMKNNSEKMPNDNYRVIYYVTQWNWPGTYDPVTQTATADVDVSKITHINYAFGHIATLDAQGNAFPGYVDVPDPAKLRALVDLKKKNPNLKVLLSIGGWGMDGFCAIASDANKTKIFANSCKQIMDEFGLDGIDIDWEYPGTIGDHLDVLTCSHLKLPTWDDNNKAANEYAVFVDGMNYIKLLREVRNVIGWDYLVTIASGVGYDWMCSSSLGELPDYLDFINIMCYDLYGDWEDHSNYNANLYPVPGNPEVDGNPLSYDVVCDRLAFRGYPRDIMNIGVPFYGRDRALGQGDASWITYRQVQELKAKGATVNWDSVTHASYLTGTVDGRTYDVTYDDVKDIQEKMAWIQEKGYGGAMVWEYSQDDEARTLTNAIWENLNGSGRKQAPPTPSYRFDGTVAGFTTGLAEPAQGETPVKGVNTIWQSWRSLIGSHPDTVYYGGYSWKRIDHTDAQNGFTWMANNHQGTFGWAPAYAPLFAQEEYKTPDCIVGSDFDVKYPAEWIKAQEYPETRFARNEAGKKTGSVNSSVLRISKIQPDKFSAPIGSTVTWDVQISGGSGSYTVTNEIWFEGLKYNQDGSVKTEKRRTGGPYPNPTAAARLDASGQLVDKEVQEGDKMNKITPTVTGTAGNQKVSATFSQEGLYYVYTVVKDGAGNIASVFSQGVQVGEGLVITPDKATLKPGETVQLSTNKPVTSWISSNNAIASVSNDGLVTAKANGTATITATSGDSGMKAYATITVSDGEIIDPPVDENIIVMKKDQTNAYVNGKLYPTTQYATGYATMQSMNGTYVLPLRYIAEVNGMQVEYMGSGQTKVTNLSTKEYLIVNRDSTLMSKYNASGTKIADFNAPQPVTVKDTVTFAPMRVVCEALGLGVSYRSTSHGSYVVVSTDTTIDSQTDKVTALIEEAYGLGL